ncbi:MAG: hypothetical protein Q4E65_01820 [Clostridia bacterium]|nr:hypothetical protein [Clostridia bacterium]
MLRKRVFVLLLAAALLLPSTLVMASVDDGLTLDISINLNERDKLIPLDIKPKGNEILINGVLVELILPNNEITSPAINTDMLRKVYSIEQLMSDELHMHTFSLNKVRIGSDSSTYTVDDDVIDFSKSGYYTINGQRMLIPSAENDQENLMNRQFELTDLDKSPLITLNVEVDEKQNDAYSDVFDFESWRKQGGFDQIQEEPS